MPYGRLHAAMEVCNLQLWSQEAQSPCAVQDKLTFSLGHFIHPPACCPFPDTELLGLLYGVAPTLS